MSASIKVERLTIPAADLGCANPLPDIKNNTYIHASIKVTDKIEPGELPNISRGMIPTMLPYPTQDGYDREKQPRELDLVVLENEYLRAEFMPSLGARLRRLYDKVNDREMLYVNPVFQPCNLALRNAWFSGGVEFNVGIKGHNPLTCSPIFAERRTDSEGHEYVSFYEYERIRGLVWSVNAYLPEGARTLTLKCRVENPTSDEKFMYWWSNIAVDETEGMRVLVPADETYVNYFGNDSYVLDKSTLPDASALGLPDDISYPGRLNRSIDFFYKIPEARRKWIASVDDKGEGFLHFSDNVLFGRKLFLWGGSAGGRHWGEYLSVPGSSYVEIQAGLAHTQLEHFPMAGNEVIEWVEHYCPLTLDAKTAHGDYIGAVNAVECELDKLIDGSDFFPELVPVKSEMLFRGSAWGALEEGLRGEKLSKCFTDWAFDKNGANPDGEYFSALLDGKSLPVTDVLDEPCGYAIGEGWEKLLRESLTKEGGAHFAAYLQLGVNLYDKFCHGDEKAGKECVEMWKKSLEAGKNPWALRNLAAFHANELHDFETAIPYALEAIGMHPANRALAIDCLKLILTSGDNRRVLDIYETLTPEVKAHGRVKLLCLKALLELDMLDEAEKILVPGFELADIKEGEISISELWFILRAKQNGITLDEAKKQFTLPYEFDFRMHD